MTESKTWTSPFALDVACRLILPEDCSEPTSLVVALHGMGQNGTVMARRARSLASAGRAVLVPDGPLPFEKRVAENRRQEGRAWYIYTGDQEAFLESARQSARWLMEQISRAVAELGLPTVKPWLVGYSQGGYLGSIMVFDHPELFSGLVSCCSRMKVEVLGEKTPAPLPVLVIHGDKDPALPVSAAKDSADELTRRGWPVDFRSWPEAEHAMLPEQWQAVREWMDQQDGKSQSQ